MFLWHGPRTVEGDGDTAFDAVEVRIDCWTDVVFIVAATDRDGWAGGVGGNCRASVLKTRSCGAC